MPNIGPFELAILLIMFLVPTILVGRLWIARGHSVATYLLVVLLLSWVGALFLALILPRGRFHPAEPSPR